MPGDQGPQWATEGKEVVVEVDETRETQRNYCTLLGRLDAYVLCRFHTFPTFPIPYVFKIKADTASLLVEACQPYSRHISVKILPMDSPEGDLSFFAPALRQLKSLRHEISIRYVITGLI